MATLPRDTLFFPDARRATLERHLPAQQNGQTRRQIPFATVTFATSLDSQLALRPGARTILSGPQSKAMTHFLRSRHDAILIGVGTAVADDPSLNCRLEGVGGYGADGLEGQPRPVIVDPTARWDFTEKSKLFALIKAGRGRAPWILTGNKNPPKEQRELLESCGGRYINIGITKSDAGDHTLDWEDVLKTLGDEGISSVMIEGGGGVINSLLTPFYSPLVSSVIITIAPTWLGRGGVVVSPPPRYSEDGAPVSAARLTDVGWYPFGEDIVLCGKIKP